MTLAFALLVYFQGYGLDRGGGNALFREKMPWRNIEYTGVYHCHG